MINAASLWSPTEYARHAAFVPELGAAALELLAPQPGELILDLGCGDGQLTAKIAEAGARVIGLDSSPAMIEAARSRGVDAFVADGEALGLERHLDRFGQFDAVFSNAALHWMLDPDAVATGVFQLLRPGGRFVGEMGGAGNLARLRAGIDAELEARGYKLPEIETHWYPTTEAFARLYATAGFTDVRAERLDRPTDLPSGIKGWVTTFRAGLFDLIMVPLWERDEIAEAIETRLSADLMKPEGGYFADYVRLRFAMRKPD